MTLTLAHTFKIMSLCTCMLIYMYVYVYVYTYTHHANTRYYHCYYITVLFSFLSQIGVLLLVVYFLLPLAFHFQFLWLTYHPPPGLAHTHSLMQESGWKDKRSINALPSLFSLFSWFWWYFLYSICARLHRDNHYKRPVVSAQYKTGPSVPLDFCHHVSQLFTCFSHRPWILHDLKGTVIRDISKGQGPIIFHITLYN